MRFFEFAHRALKRIKPLSPAEYAIAAKKRQVDQAKAALRRERDAQQRRQALEQEWKRLRRR